MPLELKKEIVLNMKSGKTTMFLGTMIDFSKDLCVVSISVPELNLYAANHTVKRCEVLCYIDDCEHKITQINLND